MLVLRQTGKKTDREGAKQCAMETLEFGSHSVKHFLQQNVNFHSVIRPLIGLTPFPLFENKMPTSI